MEVCRMRKTPVMVFVNKLDRMGLDPFDLLDEIEKELQVKTRPLSWPIDMGNKFKGVYNLWKNNLQLFIDNTKQSIGKSIQFNDISSPVLEKHIGTSSDKLREDIEIIQEVYPDFDVREYLEGELAPVFFGSALNNFGVQELLECFIAYAPPPLPSKTKEKIIYPDQEKFSGFIFKIHANMDPNHRDRIAFLKICSGTFDRNAPYTHVQQGKKYKFSSPTAFMAEKKAIIEHAYPGDIIGLHDTGNFKIGDSFSEGEKIHFQGIPSFSPELFRYIDNANPLKAKQLSKGLEQLTDEGVAQLFTQLSNNRKIIGTVGALQFDVIEYRLLHEYGASCKYENMPLYKACWFVSDDQKQLDEFIKRKHNQVALDKKGRSVFMADSAYSLQMAQEKFPEISFLFTSEYS